MADPSTASSNNTTVRFNVGGTMYEVSRSLLDQYPDTMLARLASDTWNKDGNNKATNNDALFIERDGERFKYCLDYMRDGGIVNLPSTVSKAAVLLDLEYYGFVDPDDSQISVMNEAKLDRVASIVRTWCELGCMKLIRYLLKEIENIRRVECLGLFFEFNPDDELYDIAVALCQSESIQDLFNSYLEEYGLRLEYTCKVEPSDDCGCGCQIELEKLSGPKPLAIGM